MTHTKKPRDKISQTGFLIYKINILIVKIYCKTKRALQILLVCYNKVSIETITNLNSDKIFLPVHHLLLLYKNVENKCTKNK